MDTDLGRVVDALPGMVWSARTDGRVELVNRRWHEYTGHAADGQGDRLDVAWRAALHPDDLPRWADRWPPRSAPTARWELELRLRRFDGAYRWFLCRAEPLADASGRLIRWCGINTDIDDHHRSETALHTVETNYAEFVDRFPGLIVTMNVAGQVELFSRELLDYFGKTGEELRGWQMSDAVHADDLPRVIAAFTESVASGTPYSIEHRCRRADGVYRWFRVRALAVRDDGGQVTGWYVVLTDIDDLTRAEEAVRVSEASLRELQATMARAAQVAALGEFAASIAHEVNQPLSGIVTNASTCLRMLGTDPPNVDGARETARRTIRDATRASDVITRLRALYSRKELILEPLDLNDAAREVVALSLRDIQRGRAVLHWELAEDLPRVMGDRVQLQQVIHNLLRNAVDAMAELHDRPRQMWLRTEREGDDRVRVTVRDSGVGIDRASADKLFDTFYTTKSEGMGVGLSVSRSIIARHHGRIWATPHDGPGATFAFSLPCGSAEHDRSASCDLELRGRGTSRIGTERGSTRIDLEPAKSKAPPQAR